MRYLAIDLGDKRTGVAVGDAVTRIVMPVSVVEAPLGAEGGGLLLRELSRVVREQLGDGGASEGVLVVGLPLNMDGTEGPQARKARAFGERLGAALGRAVEYQDERLTSAAADWSMARSGLTRGEKKAKRDALAAAAILSDYFAQRFGRGSGAEDDGP